MKLVWQVINRDIVRIHVHFQTRIHIWYMYMYMYIYMYRYSVCGVVAVTVAGCCGGCVLWLLWRRERREETNRTMSQLIHAETEQLNQAQRMIGGISNVLLSTYSQTENG